MAKMLKRAALLLLTMLAVNGLYFYKTYLANEKDEHPEYLRVKATAYCSGTLRCDEKPVRTGVVAGKPEWYGKVVAIYEDDNGKLGDFLGYYECLDTGGEAIRNGRVVDIYNPSYDWCINFGRRDVIIVLTEGVG